ncbi:MAG: MBL fold metallo-hydrolase [Deltaproteobacteria bacterium]|nr:MBL fold metallo-hydrolase [Deltaproteobacteria bacterium]
MNFKITTLCENNIGHGSQNLIGEHGLSFHIEAGERRLLFDTGQNLAIANNADVLGIDLSCIDTVVLSHGHYDHSSGLKSLVNCNTDFTLHAHPDVFGSKQKGTGDNYKYIGIPIERKNLEQKGIKIQLDKDPVTVAPGMTTTGEIPLENDFEAVEPDFFIQNGEEYPADTLPDDRALILDTEKGSVVLLGCSHRGVVNTLNHVIQITGRAKIHAILGGLHLGKASKEKLDKIVEHLHAFGLEKIGVGHCTGPKAFVALVNAFSEKVFLNTVGNVIEF